MPFLAFSSPAVWCRVFRFRVFQSCSFDRAVFSGLAFSVPQLRPSMAEIISLVWGTPANFNGFRVLASLLQRRRSTKSTKLCTMFGRLLAWYTIHTLSGSLDPWRNFATCKIHFTSKCCVLLYWQRYCTALQQRALAKLCGVVQGMELRNFRRGCHLYSAGRSSRWSSAHISSYNWI